MFSLSTGVRLFGLIFSMVLYFYYGKKASANRWLALFVFSVLTYSLFFSAFIDGHSTLWVAVLGGLVSPLFFLIGPCGFLYVRTFLHFNAGIKKRDLLHFLPGVVMLSGVIPYWLKGWEDKKSIAKIMLMGLQNPNKEAFNSIVTPLQFRFLGSFHLLAYMVAIWIVMILYSKPFRLKNEDYTQNQPQLRWLWIFGALFSSCSVLYADLYLRNLYVSTMALDYNKDAFIIELVNLLLFLLVFLAVFFPMVLNGFASFRKQEKNLAQQVPGLQEHAKVVKHIHIETEQNIEKPTPPLLTHSYLSEIKRRLQATIDERWYTEPDFKLSDLAIRLQTPQHHLSQYFSQVHKQGFPVWRNQLRVDYAKSLIDKGWHYDLNMEGLATKVGFTNRSTFSVVFKNLTGSTLTEYIKKQNLHQE